MFKKPQQRPYLKVCTKCHGKGQLSYFNTAQDKKYGACTKCSNGNAINGGLGVTLKCACQPKSSKYDYLRSTDLPYIKGVDRAIVAGIKEYQAELGDSGTAIVLMCSCGARYLVNDVGERCKIRGEKAMNKADKDVNKRVAAELAARGIAKVLQAPPRSGPVAP